MIKPICPDELEQILKPNFMKALKSSGLRSFSFSDKAKAVGFYNEDRVLGVLFYRELEKALLAEIDFIATLEVAQRQGVGRALLLHLEEAYQEIWLELSAQNQEAFRFYESQGFKKLGERKDYYGKGVNAINMVKRGVARLP
jgi:ribosomal protein S18 acetylase RimI-like enzyme